MGNDADRSSSQQYENLVFEAGGVKGIAYFGAILELEKQGVLKGIKRYAGTSSGSIFATMLAIGFTAQEIYEWRETLSFSKASVKFPPLALLSLIFTFGMKNVKTVTDQIKTKMMERVEPDITLAELYDRTGKELVIVACNLNRRKPIYFHHATYPDVKVLDAVACSVCAPYIFKPQVRDYMGSRDYYTDGGVADSYPIWVYNDMEKLYAGRVNEIVDDYVSPKTLGIKLLSGDEKNDYDIYTGRERIWNIINFTIEAISTMVYQVERMVVSDTYIKQTIGINTRNTLVFDFNISRFNREVLVEEGTKSVRNYFQK